MELCAIVHLPNYGNWQALSNFTSQRRRLFLYPVFSAYGKKVVPVHCVFSKSSIGVAGCGAAVALSDAVLVGSKEKETLRSLIFVLYFSTPECSEV